MGARFIFSCVFLVASLNFLCLTTCQSVPYKEKYFDQYIDHFNILSHGQKTFKQRYLIQDKWWNEKQGPIFFYTGNEGPITAFWDATGFVFDIAPQFDALIVFAEHRYYGKSLPFGDDSFTKDNIGLLTIEQALADYAVLIDYLQGALNAKNRPVIAFGGSYGGMLSAWMRFKYPNVITGSIAASAPIFLLADNIDRDFFFTDVTKDFESVSEECVNRVKKSFIMMNQLAAEGQMGLKKMSHTFQLCSPLANGDDYIHLQGWIRNSFTYLAMLDYPYPAKFVASLPADPVNVACGYLMAAGDDLTGMAKAAGLFYNGTDGQLQCFDIKKEFVPCADPTGCGTGPDSLAWDFQACTEIHLTNGSNNVTDMFPALSFTPEERATYCQKKWGVTPRDAWSAVEFWGKNIKTASNIVFSNGDLDPWRRGGVYISSPSPSVTIVTIKGGAHHLDLRGQNPKDPISVIEAREMEKNATRYWINEHWLQLNRTN